jgi:hypothetical protein
MNDSDSGFTGLLRKIVVSVFFLSGTCAAGACPPERDLTNPPAQNQSESRSSDPATTHLVQVDSGSVIDNLYRSDFFGFTYLFPKGWSVQGEVTKKYLMDVGRALVTGGDPTKTAVMDISEKRSHQLLTVFEHPVGTPVPFNPGLIVMTEDVSFAPGIQKGSDYLLNVKMGVEKRHPELKILREPTEQSFGGKSFFRMDVSFEISTGATVFESYSSTILNGNALTFIFYLFRRKTGASAIIVGHTQYTRIQGRRKLRRNCVQRKSCSRGLSARQATKCGANPHTHQWG